VGGAEASVARKQEEDTMDDVKRILGASEIIRLHLDIEEHLRNRG